MAQPSFRAIAPTPGQPVELDQPPISELQARRHVTVACQACKKRRSKCDGGVPCVACISKETECIRSEGDDGRRKLAIKRKIESLEKERDLLEVLLDALQAAKPSQLDALAQRIRMNPSRLDLRNFLQAEFHNAQEINQTDVRRNQQRTHRRMLGRIEDVVNPPIAVPARPWTTVTDNDDFVSHLISLWFTWMHPWWHWVEKAAFLEAMRSGKTSSLICTPYLVNMILADACLLDSLTDADSEPNMWIQEQFYTEAKKRIDAEQGKASLALVATLGVQWTYLHNIGKDEAGNAILFQQAFLSKNLTKWRRKIGKASSLKQVELDTVDKCLERLQWTTYALTSCTRISSGQTRLLEAPPSPRFVHDHDACDEKESWLPYPSSHTPVLYHSDCHYYSFMALVEKVTRDEILFLEQEEWDVVDTSQRVRKLYTEIKGWPKTLPECMSLHDGAMPHVIALQTLGVCNLHVQSGLHLWFIVILSKQIASLEAGMAERPLLVQTPRSSEQHFWRDVSLSSASRISELLEQIRFVWGGHQFPVIITLPATVAAFALLEGLQSHLTSEEAFFRVCITLRAASRRFRVCRGVRRLLLHTAEQNGIELSEGCGQLLADVETSMDVETAPSEGEDIGLEHLLEKWDDLDL